MARSTVSSPLRIHPPELLQQIDVLAKMDGMSRNEWIVRVLANTVNRSIGKARK